MRSPVPRLIAVALVAALGKIAFDSARTTPPRSRIVRVPKISEPITIDSESEEPAWRAPGRTLAFQFPNGGDARPYSDARFLHDDSSLYFVLYAADQDIEKKSDAFLLAFVSPKDGSILTLRIGADGSVRGKRVRDERDSLWDPQAKVAIDVDGTFDDPSDEDEEWVVEGSIPLAAILDGTDAKTVTASVARCDTPKGSVEVCAQWGARPPSSIVGVLAL